MKRAQQAFEKTQGPKRESQRDVVRALDLNRSFVSRALRNAGLKHEAQRMSETFQAIEDTSEAMTAIRLAGSEASDASTEAYERFQEMSSEEKEAFREKLDEIDREELLKAKEKHLRAKLSEDGVRLTAFRSD